MVDSHCHLAGPEFTEDLSAVIERARNAGVAYALVILAADNEPEIEQGRKVATGWDAVRFSVGIHPHAAGKFAADPAAAAQSVDAVIDGQPLTRALGEIGLDYHYDFAPRDVQQQVFREQIRLARRRRLPIVIHTREADDDTFRILEEESAQEIGGVFHCFTGDRAMARRALDIGFHISLAGIVTFPAGARAEGSGEAGADRSPAHRNRQPVSRARAESRETKRTGQRGPRRGNGRDAARQRRGVNRRSGAAQLRASLHPVTATSDTD